jgi:pimeloyl-ACP methyl ester carboxylesterase
MQAARLDGVELKYRVVGSGEPVLLIHGGFIADTFVPLLAEPRLVDSYRLITYHRRGYGDSSRAAAPFTIKQQADDARALLRHLGISRAHVAGHSYGGVIAIQLSLDAPDLVASLALLEPALVALVPSAPMFMRLLDSVQAMHQCGDRVGATDAFLTQVMGPAYRPLLDEALPSGAFEQAVVDSDTCIGVELEALQRWRFSAEDATRIQQPALSVIGGESGPVFDEIHSLLKKWIPRLEELTVPHANHALQYMNPGAVADGLRGFFDGHRH